MTIQSSTQIGDIIRNAVVFNIKNWLGGTMNSDSLLHDYQPNMAALLNELSKYVNENDLAEIKGVVSDIQKRIKRFKNESSE